MIKVAKTVAVALVLAASAAPAYAQSTYDSYDSITDGGAAAQAGTNVFNAFNQDTPLPNSGGNVVQDTIYNLGAGQSFSEAWQNASDSNSDAGSIDPE